MNNTTTSQRTDSQTDRRTLPLHVELKKNIVSVYRRKYFKTPFCFFSSSIFSPGQTRLILSVAKQAIVSWNAGFFFNAGRVSTCMQFLLWVAVSFSFSLFQVSPASCSWSVHSKLLILQTLAAPTTWTGDGSLLLSSSSSFFFLLSSFFFLLSSLLFFFTRSSSTSIYYLLYSFSFFSPLSYFFLFLFLPLSTFRSSLFLCFNPPALFLLSSFFLLSSSFFFFLLSSSSFFCLLSSFLFFFILSPSFFYLPSSSTHSGPRLYAATTAAPSAPSDEVILLPPPWHEPLISEIGVGAL